MTQRRTTAYSRRLVHQRAIERRVRASARRNDGTTASRKRRVRVAAPAAYGASNGRRARVARRRGEFRLGGGSARGCWQAKELALGGREGDVGEVISWAEEREAGEADLGYGDELDCGPCPA